MGVQQASMACPLCHRSNVFKVKQVDTVPLAAYWKAYGYDLYGAHPQLRDGLSKWQCVDCDLCFFSPQAIGGSDLYAALGRNPAYYNASKWEFSFVLRKLSRRQRGGALLEVGCGPGQFLERAAVYFDRAIGVDLNEDAVREGRTRGLDLRVAGLDTLNETFDTIVAFQLIEHLPDPGATLRRLVNLLRPGGELIVAVPNDESFLGDMDRNWLNLPPHHATCWARETFESVAHLFSIALEDYCREPLSVDLYLGALHERFDKYLGGRNALMRPWLWLVRRAAIANALVTFDLVRQHECGHTHIAFFRKPDAIK